MGECNSRKIHHAQPVVGDFGHPVNPDFFFLNKHDKRTWPQQMNLYAK